MIKTRAKRATVRGTDYLKFINAGILATDTRCLNEWIMILKTLWKVYKHRHVHTHSRVQICKHRHMRVKKKFISEQIHCTYTNVITTHTQEYLKIYGHKSTDTITQTVSELRSRSVSWVWSCERCWAVKISTHRSLSCLLPPLSRNKTTPPSLCSVSFSA